jgi:hypothetical protein
VALEKSVFPLSVESLTVGVALEKSVFPLSITLHHHQRLTAKEVMSGGGNICAYNMLHTADSRGTISFLHITAMRAV